MATGTLANKDPTFNLPTGSASDFYLSREVNDTENSNHGKIIKKKGLWKYPFLTRRTGDSLVGTNEEITSSELTHGRTPSKTKLGNASSSGSHDFEFSPETFDDQLEGTFRSEWIRFHNDGQKNGIAKDYLTPKGFIHVRGDNGTYGQVPTGKTVTQVPLFYTENEAGDENDPYGLIKVSEKVFGFKKRELTEAEVSAGASPHPFGKFVVHELHVGEKPVKYSFMSRIPINGNTVRYQDYKHVENSEMNLNVTVNAIVTGSFSLMGSNNPSYYTEVAENGKVRMAERMAEDKDVAVGQNKDETYSSDFADAAEKFLHTVKNTVKSTETDQFTALEGFLYVNGHQLQFASDLTFDINNNLQPINAIFVKNAIANIAPKLDITGNITAYFTDGEVDGTGKKFGTDDLKNIASQNKDAEIVFAFQDKEDPEVIYLFQIFKSTLTPSSESKDADNPITLDLSYASYGSLATRVLRLAIPKIRGIEFDTETVVSGIKAGDDVSEIELRLYPNVPLDATEESAYVDSASDLYVFKNAEVTVNSAELASDAYEFSNAVINDDGSISAKLELTSNFAKGDLIKIKLTVNDTDVEGAAEIVPEISYMRMGKTYAENEYASKVVALDTPIDILTAQSGTGDESYLFYIYDRRNGFNFGADDLNFVSSDEEVATVDASGVITKGSVEGTAEITVSSKSDADVKYSFVVSTSSSSETEYFSDISEFLSEATEVETGVTYEDGEGETHDDGVTYSYNGTTYLYDGTRLYTGTVSGGEWSNLVAVDVTTIEKV